MKRPADWLTYVIWACVAVVFGIVLTWFVTGEAVGSPALVVCSGIAAALHPIRSIRANSRAAMSPEESMRDKVVRGLGDKY